MGKEPSNDDELGTSDVWRWILRIPRPVFLVVAVVVAVGIGLLIRGGSDGSNARPPTGPPATIEDLGAKLTIAELLDLDGQFDAFRRYAGTAGLLDSLGGDGPVTVFVPREDAIDRLPATELETLTSDPERLRRYLESYIVDADVPFVSLLSGKVISLTSRAGTTINVEVGDAGVLVNGALVTKHDITASNGLVHVLGSAFSPPADG